MTAAAVLGVTEPFSSGIGGGGFMVIRTPDGAVRTIDSRETALAAMHAQSFWEKGAPLAFSGAVQRSVGGVPGTVAAGTRRLTGMARSRFVVRWPAIEVAHEGFVIDRTFSEQTQATTLWFDDLPASEGLFLDPDGTPRDVGSVFRNLDLAKTYARIAKLGRRAFVVAPWPLRSRTRSARRRSLLMPTTCGGRP